MKPVLRAATVAMTLALSYGMIASSPAAAGSNDESDLAHGKPLRTRTVGPRVAVPANIQNDPQPVQPHATITRAKPYDVNGDGKADAVVGATREDLGYDTDAGMLHILYGRFSGITTYGDQVIHQDTYGVPGSTEDGDWFAWTNTSGDFNADGYADVAVSTIQEDIGTVPDAGLVQVFYGSTNGLRTRGVTSLSAPRPYREFGTGLSAGDFNGDGRDDLAVGGPGGYDAGSVFVYTGTDSGLSTTYQEFMQGADVPGIPLIGEGFGESMEAGDINGDGYADLAIGAASDADDLGVETPTGSVTILYGTATGLNSNHDGQRFTKQTPGVPGDSGSYAEDETPDLFGFDVTLADFNGNGKADLAVSAPGSPLVDNGVRRPDAGTVTVLYSNGTQIGTDNAIEITEATSGIPGIPSNYDYLGYTVTGGDPNGDGKLELAMFSLGDGYVTVIPGSATGLATGSAKGWTQDSPGIPGIDEPGDFWGASLRFEEIKGAGRDSLLVGATGENDSRGAFTVIHSTSTGLTGTGSQVFSQDMYGVKGTAEADDLFGAFF